MMGIQLCDIILTVTPICLKYLLSVYVTCIAIDYVDIDLETDDIVDIDIVIDDRCRLQIQSYLGTQLF